MQKENVLMAGFLAAMFFCWGAALAQDFAPETGTFIKAGEMNGLCRLDIIDDGSYELYFKQGQSWNASTGKFEINATGSRMEEPLIFATQKTPEGVRYTWGQVTLEEVPDGNAVVVPVSEEDFPV
ncbi:MAG: hypothetical protein NTY37_12015 [Methanothrix sp.]|nr:hypothetical protein [Methanothrix sp.]